MTKNDQELKRIFDLGMQELGMEFVLEQNDCKGYHSDMLRIKNSGVLEDVTISITSEEGKETRTRINIWAYPNNSWNPRYIKFLEYLKNEAIWVNSSDDTEDYNIEDGIHYIWQTHIEE